jgi:hypothetical protein
MLTNEDERTITKAIKAKTGSFRFFTQSIEAYSKSGNIKAYRKKKEERKKKKEKRVVGFYGSKSTLAHEVVGSFAYHHSR